MHLLDTHTHTHTHTHTYTHMQTHPYANTPICKHTQNIDGLLCQNFNITSYCVIVYIMLYHDTKKTACIEL